MIVSLCQLNYTVGDIEGNKIKIKEAILKAKKEGSKLIVFSELAICGYPPKDLLLYPSFVQSCEQAIQDLVKHVDQEYVVIGCPTQSQSKVNNSLLVLHQDKIYQTYHKQLLPTYDVFDERRYFEPAQDASILEIEGLRFALSICEDIWDETYTHSPLDQVTSSIDYIINISASPFHTNHIHEREQVILKAVHKKKAGLIYVNQIGANTDLIFDGSSCVFNAKGEKQAQLPAFEEKIACFNLNTPPLSSKTEISPLKPIYEALILGIRDYFGKNKFKKAILGLSGGIDSAMVLCLAQEALGKENVLPVLLPSKYSSEGSVDDSVTLCQNLGISYLNIPIESTNQAILSDLKPFFEGKTEDVTEENIQARIRGLFLMALANKHHCVLLNTTNKSEAAVGYGTLYGDLCGGLAVLGDVYKTQVYELAHWINREKGIIPYNIITKAPSAELRPDQKDSDSLPDYAVLDPILKDYLEEFYSERELIKKYKVKNLIQKVLNLVTHNEYKRFQMAPVLRISKRAFGDGRNMPLVGRLNV